ncbi:hypothetical protein WMY93_030010 [Mugilogobius chulae]|uniref:Homeobox domain-containing protein n=1 Tax=Mugilogobius chulae TaxID=88201 RepID=A0AAW0MY99_9GOBI
MYQNGPEQNNMHLSAWTEPGLTDAGNYTSAQGYYPPAAPEPQSPASPPKSPEPHAYSGHGQYQGPGMVCIGESETSRLLLTGQTREHEARRTGSDSASDSDPQTPPDSWSSGSSGEGCLPQADPTTWAQKANLDDETSSRSPDSTEDLKDESQSYSILCNEGTNDKTNASAPLPAQRSKMNALAQRFNVQRYLTPAEMKNLVKTWFQNRRMKLRRHQKDNTWASERYTIKDKTGPGAVFTNRPSHMQTYEGQTRPALIEAALKKTAPPNLAFYLAAMGGVPGSNGYPVWPPNAAQNAFHGRPQAPSWPLPSNTPHYNYNTFNNPSHSGNVSDTGFKAGELINRPALNSVIVQNTAQ